MNTEHKNNTEAENKDSLTASHGEAIEDKDKAEESDESKKTETVIAPFDISKDDAADGDTTTPPEKVEKKSKHISIGKSASQTMKLFKQLTVEHVWVAIVLGGGLVSVGFFAYAGVLFWKVAYFESYIDSSSLDNQKEGVLLDEEEFKRTIRIFEEREQAFEERQNNPPVIDEVR